MHKNSKPDEILTYVKYLYLPNLLGSRHNPCHYIWHKYSNGLGTESNYSLIGKKISSVSLTLRGLLADIYCNSLWQQVKFLTSWPASMLRPLASQDYPLTECEIYIRESNTCERNVVGLGRQFLHFHRPYFWGILADIYCNSTASKISSSWPASILRPLGIKLIYGYIHIEYTWQAVKFWLPDLPKLLVYL